MNSVNEEIEIATSFSDDRKYRYMLVRDIDALATAMGHGDFQMAVTFLMLNPSTANENHNDPTIRRCSDFAARWGYGRLIVVNLSPLRATDPKDLLAAGREPDEVWERNMQHVMAAANASSRVILAYGVNGEVLTRDQYVVGRLKDVMSTRLYCLGYTKNGMPLHPLYVPKDVRPVPFILA